MKEPDRNDPVMSGALLRTLNAACLPPPLCARALAYTFISDDRELSFEFMTRREEFNAYWEEYTKYLIPLVGADKNYKKNLY
jgi:hypothetical protein